MSKKSRLILFFFCFLLFLTITPSVILYSQGYRLNWESKKIIKTGGLYFKVIPKGAEIFINGKSAEKTDIFFASAFIENLLPNKYFIEIKKPGYLSWQKNLDVFAGKVTEAKNIVLFPENLKFKILAQEIENVFLSPDKSIFIFKESIPNQENETSDKTLENSNWALKLYDPKTDIKSQLINSQDILKTDKKSNNIFKGLEWSLDQKSLLLTTEDNEQNKYFLLSLKNNPVTIKPLKFSEKIINPKLHPSDPNKIFFQQKMNSSINVFEFDILSQNSNLILENVFAYELSDNNIFWLSQNGFLKKTSFSGQTNNLSITPLLIKEKENYQILILGPYIFVQENETLFFFDPETQIFREIATGIKSFTLSEDNKKICFWNDFELWIYFLKQELGQPQRQKGGKIFLTRFSEKIEKASWYDAHHLIFNTGANIKIIEIDDRDKIQTWDLAQFLEPEIYWNSIDKKIYILSNKNVLVSEKI